MKKCFIISPIGEEGSEIRKNADEALRYVIEPACVAKGYEPIRADKISDTGMITQSIIEHILKDDIAIIDITGCNANVFYELAIRHSYGLPAIQITRDDASLIPFDVHNVRTIQYDLTASGADKAKQTLEAAIESIEKDGSPLNPVTSVSGILSLSPDLSRENDDVLSELLLKVNSIPEKLEQLENNIGIRFSQMLTAFGDSMKIGSEHKTEDDIKNEMLKSFLTTMMNDPNKGMNQMQNLMKVQKYFEDNNFSKGSK